MVEAVTWLENAVSCPTITIAENMRTVIQWSLDNAEDICGYAEPKIYLMGFSAGGGAIAAISSEFSEIRKILLIAPSFDADFNSIKQGLERFQGEVYITVGDRDDVVGTGTIDRFKELSTSAACVKTSSVPDCDHQFRGETNGYFLSAAPIWAFTNETNSLDPNSGIYLYPDMGTSVSLPVDSDLLLGAQMNTLGSHRGEGEYVPNETQTVQSIHDGILQVQNGVSLATGVSTLSLSTPFFGESRLKPPNFPFEATQLDHEELANNAKRAFSSNFVGNFRARRALRAYVAQRAQELTYEFEVAGAKHLQFFLKAGDTSADILHVDLGAMDPKDVDIRYIETLDAQLFDKNTPHSTPEQMLGTRYLKEKYVSRRELSNIFESTENSEDPNENRQLLIRRVNEVLTKNTSLENRNFSEIKIGTWGLFTSGAGGLVHDAPTVLPQRILNRLVFGAIASF